jgi:hypothetical protein
MGRTARPAPRRRCGSPRATAATEGPCAHSALTECTSSKVTATWSSSQVSSRWRTHMRARVFQNNTRMGAAKVTSSSQGPPPPPPPHGARDSTRNIDAPSARAGVGQRIERRG